MYSQIKFVIERSSTNCSYIVTAIPSFIRFSGQLDKATNSHLSSSATNELLSARESRNPNFRRYSWPISIGFCWDFSFCWIHDDNVPMTKWTNDVDTENWQRNHDKVLIHADMLPSDMSVYLRRFRLWMFMTFVCVCRQSCIYFQFVISINSRSVVWY